MKFIVLMWAYAAMKDINPADTRDVESLPGRICTESPSTPVASSGNPSQNLKKPDTFTARIKSLITLLLGSTVESGGNRTHDLSVPQRGPPSPSA